MDSDWDRIREDRSGILGVASMGALRVALLFGSAAVALALIVVPIAENQTKAFSSAGIDRMTTGSIGQAGSYTIRRSVLQSSPNSICVIRDNGARSGDCN